MATNTDRLAALKTAVGDEKAADVLAQAKAMSEKAAEFLASKEIKEEPKDEPVVDQTKVEDAALKEIKDLLVATSKENKETVEALKATLVAEQEKAAKVVEGLQTDLAQLQLGYAALLGFQPKAFKASEKGKEADLTEEQKKKADKTKEAIGEADGILGLADFVMGTRDAAAA